MGFFSSRKAEPTPLSVSELNASSSGSVKVIKSRFYGKTKATTSTSITHANPEALPSGSNMQINATSSTSNRPFASSSSSSSSPAPPPPPPPQAIPPRHISSDPLTTTLAEKLNELALANADGLLDDEAHRLLRQNLFERYSQAEAQTQSTSSRTHHETSAGKRLSSGIGPSNDSTGKKRASWRNPGTASSLNSPPSTIKSPSKTLNRAPSIESQRSITTAVSSLFRRATRRSGSSSRGPTSPGGGFMYDQEHDHEASSIYSRPSFSSNNFPYSGAYGSMIRGMGMSRQLSSDSLVSVGTNVGSVTGSVAGFPSHLQIHTSHSTLGLNSAGFPPSPSSASAPVDIRTLSVSRRMLGTYASSISSRTTSRSNKPPSSYHLRHATTNLTPSHSNTGQSSSQSLSISALVKARSHEDDAENDEYAHGYDDFDDHKSKDQPPQPPPPLPASSGLKAAKSAATLRAEIEAMEAEGRKVLEAFNALELSVLTRGGRMHIGGGGGSSSISSVPEEIISSIPVDAVSIKSVKSSSSSKDKEKERDKGGGRGGSSGSSSGMSGSIAASSSLTASISTSTTTTATTVHTTTTNATSISASSNLSLPPQPVLHTSHSSPSLLNSMSTQSSNSKSYTNAQGTSLITPAPAPHHPVPAIPITPLTKKRPSILLQRRKTAGKAVVLPPSIVAASLEIKEREKKERERASGSTTPSISVITVSTSVPTTTTSTDGGPPSTRVRTRSHSRERPAREKPPSSIQPAPPPPPPLPSLPPLPTSKHPYADPSLALSLADQSQTHPSLGAVSSLTDELSIIRQRRVTVAKRYDRRLEFLRAKLKSAEIREMLK